MPKKKKTNFSAKTKQAKYVKSRKLQRTALLAALAATETPAHSQESRENAHCLETQPQHMDEAEEKTEVEWPEKEQAEYLATQRETEMSEQRAKSQAEYFELKCEVELGNFQVPDCDELNIKEEKTIIKSEPLYLDSNVDEDSQVNCETALKKDKVPNCDPTKIEEIYIKTENQSDSGAESFLDEEEQVDRVGNPSYKSNKELANPDRLAQPEKPPNSAYGLFSKLMLQDKCHNNKGQRDLFKKIAIKWIEVPEEEKRIYTERVQNMHKTYKLEVEKYLENFPDDMKAEVLANLRSRKINKTRNKFNKGSLNEVRTNLARNQDGNVSSCEEDVNFESEKDIKKINKSEGTKFVASVIDGCTTFCCQICTYKSTNLLDIRNHLPTHTSGKPYQCKVCLYSYSYPSSLKRHMASHAESGTAVWSYDCTVCSYSGRDYSALTRHMAIHSEDRLYDCHICAYSSKDPTTLRRHVATHMPDKQYKCAICSYSCVQSGLLKRHMLTHCQEKPFKCSLCSYDCLQSKSLKRHMANHTGFKPFKCSMCLYSGVDSASLTRHMASHIELPGVSVDGDKDAVKSHDSENKPHKCSMCPYGTVKLSLLKRHMAVHTDLRPFKCSLCSYSGRQSSSLKLHMATHTGIRPFKCTVCSFSGVDSKSLKRHMGTHFERRRYTCSDCSYSSKDPATLKRHIFTQHKLDFKKGLAAALG